MALALTGQPQNAQLVVGGSDVGPANPVPTSIAGSPRGPRVARTVHMASAALPAAGAYTANAAYAIPDGVQFVSFWVTYTTGSGVAGACKAKLVVGNGTESGTEVTIDPTITVAQPAGLQLAYMSEIELPIPPVNGTRTDVLTWAVRAGETTIALQLAEVGVTATPGTAAVALTAGY